MRSETYTRLGSAQASKKVWSEWAYTSGILFLVVVILLISVIVVGLLFMAVIRT